ncbi:MAG: hypothetical protein ABI647_17555 [Gemmatimonadota bacterium]
MAQHFSTWIMAFSLAMPPVGGIQLTHEQARTDGVEWQGPSQGKPKPQKPPRGQSTGEPTLKRRKPPAPPHG